MKKVIQKIVILPIRFYQLAISPMLGPHCRFTPTCSHHTVEAIQEWGVLKGLWLGTKRLSQCHPFSKKHGHDPVPKRKEEGGKSKEQRRRMKEEDARIKSQESRR